MSTSTLTQFQRGQLGQLVSEGSTYQVMADALGVAKSTIHYELQRITPYNAELAQLDADTKRKACGRHSILTPDKQRLIENHLRLTWSPEMIARMFNFATASIYHWLNTGQLNFDLTNLPNRNIYQKRSKEKRGTLDLINNRPLKINQLQTAIEKFRACSD